LFRQKKKLFSKKRKKTIFLQKEEGNERVPKLFLDFFFYLVAGAAAFAVLEQWLVAAGAHGHERVLVGVLEPARTT
jgi:hypothetical protein